MTARQGTMARMGLGDGSTPFSLVLGQGAETQILVAGADVTEQVSALRLDAAEGRSPILTLIGRAGGVVDGEGIVTTVAEAHDPGEVISDFLSRVDPARLEAAALARDVPYGEAMTMQAALLVLIDWATGA